MEKKKKNGDGVSDAEVENVMKLLMAYKEARSQGLAPLNPQLQDILAAMEENNSLLHEDAADITIPSTATKGATDRTSDELVPKPFFVVKTKNEKKQKVFINVCGSHKIEAPDYGHDINSPTQIDQLMATLENFQNQEGQESFAPDVRFPLSCLEPNKSTDKSSPHTLACSSFSFIAV
jgi:hypothetical protein